MNDVAIRAEDLGKQYRIGASEVPYRTLRETAVDLATAPVRRLVSGLRGQGVSRSSETIWALKNVSFEVRQGEAVGIIGRNGAGKTTLLKILSRITKPTEGRASLGGRAGSLLEIGTGFHPELTGRENIYLNGAILGMRRAEIERKFEEIVAFAEIEKFLDTPVKHYSSGMYVRLAFGVAAHLEPDILMVDEVLAVGDAAFQKKCLGKMGEVASEGRTVLFVSHNMGAIASLCSRAMLLEGGRVIYEGDSESAIQKYFERLEGRRHLALSERKDRKGTGVCRFTKLSFGGLDGRQLEVLQSGQDVQIILDYESREETTFSSVKAIVEVAHSMYGTVLYASSQQSGDLSSGIPSNGRLVCNMKRLPLLPGLYSLKVALKIGREIADWIDGAITIQVVEGDFYGTGRLPSKGMFLAQYSWDFVPIQSQILHSGSSGANQDG